MDGPPVAVKRKKRKRGKEGLRKRRKPDDDDPEDDGAGCSNALAALKADQRLRRRAGGIDAAKLLKVAGGAATAGAAAASGDAADGADESTIAAAPQWAAERSAHDGDGENPQMLQYIEEQMARQRQQREQQQRQSRARGGGDAETSAAATGNGETGEESLYKLPDRLKARGRTADGTFDGGPLAWNTGIAEVELPTEHRLQNIERTERAKQERMRSRNSGDARGSDRQWRAPGEGGGNGGGGGSGGGGGGDGGGGGGGGSSGGGGDAERTAGSLAANFRHHRREHAKDVRSYYKEINPGRRRGGPGQSTDDEIAQRYRKRMAKTRYR